MGFREPVDVEAFQHPGELSLASQPVRTVNAFCCPYDGNEMLTRAGGQRPLPPLCSAIPGRARPDLDADQLQDLVFVTMGVTSSACLRIALQRPPDSDRDAMVALTARMLAAALTPD